MKKLGILLLALCACVTAGCRGSVVEAKFAQGHKAALGCWPKGYTPPRELEAVGPKPDTCGTPIYKRPACSECVGDKCAVPSPEVK